MATGQLEHSPQDVDAALTQIAMCAGNVSRAHRQLEEEGHEISYRTMADWKHRYELRYARIVRQVREERKEETAERIDDLTQQQIGAMQDTLDAYKTALAAGKVPAKDLSRAMRDLATSLGIGNQNAQLLRGEPTEIIEGSITDMRRRMAHHLSDFLGTDSIYRTDLRALVEYARHLESVVGASALAEIQEAHRAANGDEQPHHEHAPWWNGPWRTMPALKIALGHRQPDFTAKWLCETNPPVVLDLFEDFSHDDEDALSVGS